MFGMVHESRHEYQQQIVALNGEVHRTMPTRTNENGVVKFIVYSEYMY